MPTQFETNARPITEKYNNRLRQKLAKRKLDTQRNIRNISPVEDFKKDYKKKKLTKMKTSYQKRQAELINK